MAGSLADVDDLRSADGYDLGHVNKRLDCLGA